MSFDDGWVGAGHGVGTSAASPPGWYADPWGEAGQRFWDGSTWTLHTAAGRAPRPRLPQGAPLYGASIWLLAVLPVLSALVIWLYRVDPSGMADYFRALDDASRTGATPDVTAPNPLTMFGPGYAISMVLSPVMFTALVILAYRDWAHLGRIGVVRPFHWAWAFLGSIVYVIGRSVVVGRIAAPRGHAPMWVAIGVQVAAYASIGIWMAMFFASVVQQVPGGLS